MGKKAGPRSGTKNGGGGGGVAPKSKQIQKTPRDKAVAGFVQKKSDKFRDKGKKGPQIKKAMKVANVQARAALASGEVSVVNSYLNSGTACTAFLKICGQFQ